MSATVVSIQSGIRELKDKATHLKRKVIVMQDQYMALAKQRREEALKDDKLTKHYGGEINVQERINERELCEFETSIQLLNNEKERAIKYVTNVYEQKREALEVKQNTELKGIAEKFESKQNALQMKEDNRKEKREKNILVFKEKLEETFVTKPLEVKYPNEYYKLKSQLDDIERQISSNETLIEVVKQGEIQEGIAWTQPFQKKSHFDEDDSWMRSPEYIAEEKIRKQRYVTQMTEHKKRIEEAEEANRQTELAAALAKRGIREAEEQRVKQKYENKALGISTATATATHPKKQKDEEQDEEQEDNSACGDEEEYEPYEAPTKEELMEDYQSFVRKGNLERANFKKSQLREIYKVFL